MSDEAKTIITYPFAFDHPVQEDPFFKNEYVVQKQDYLKEIKFTNTPIVIGLCEVKGWREEQQDCLAVDILPIFAQYTTEMRKKYLSKVFTELQNRYGQKQESGSTANVTMAWIQEIVNENNQPITVLHITNAHVGDSAAYIFIMDEHDHLVDARMINQTLHHRDSPYRLGGRLAVTRAIGDTHFEKYGLSHAPDIVEDTMILSAQQRVFVVSACDGLTESNSVSMADMGNMIIQHKESPKTVAFELVKAALSVTPQKYGSTDNISVVFAEILPQQPAIAIAVFDGHGREGGALALQLGEHIYQILNEQTH